MEKKTCKETVYISGPITGQLDCAKQIFEAAELGLKKQGFKVLNPFKFNDDHDKTWEAYMKVCIKQLLKADKIYMLPYWQRSKGAVIEHQIASDLGINIHYILNVNRI